MRLINIYTLQLQEFMDDKIPAYAILSHTWGIEEVTFQDWKDLALASKKAGFSKIIGACDRAKQDGHDWLWVDTNCIDKSSSAELSEAINSMFAWYRDSAICYVYLADVDISLDIPSPSTCDSESESESDSWEEIRKSIAKARHRITHTIGTSRWFTRGWTLQELLAPKDCVFLSHDWTEIASKNWATCLDALQDITGIPAEYLENPSRIFEASISQRMSWMGTRQTTRTEDKAYCLLGIFRINMPLLYGEGLRAFTRLQEEIIKVSTDHTIFCWEWVESKIPDGWVSILAPEPGLFHNSGGYHSPRQEHSVMELQGRQPLMRPYTVTNAGLEITLPLLTTPSGGLAVLNVCDCHDEYDGLDYHECLDSYTVFTCLPLYWLVDRYYRCSEGCVATFMTFYPTDIETIIISTGTATTSERSKPRLNQLVPGSDVDLLLAFFNEPLTVAYSFTKLVPEGVVAVTDELFRPLEGSVLRFFPTTYYETPWTFVLLRLVSGNHNLDILFCHHVCTWVWHCEVLEDPCSQLCLEGIDKASHKIAELSAVPDAYFATGGGISILIQRLDMSSNIYRGMRPYTFSAKLVLTDFEVDSIEIASEQREEPYACPRLFS